MEIQTYKSKGKPNAELLAIKKEELFLLETQGKIDHIGLFYGDETVISKLAYVPLTVSKKKAKMPVMENSRRPLSCFGILSKDNKLFSKTTIGSINAVFIVDFFE